MKLANSVRKSFFAVAVATASAYPTSSFGQVLFRPSLYEITVYEAGLQSSATGERSPIFKNDSGVTVDLANPGTLRSLSPTISLKPGSWDMIYSITSNTQRYAGSDGAGCHIRAGTATFPVPDNNPLIGTANAGNAGTRSVTFIALNVAGTDLGPTTTPLTSMIDGIGVNNLKTWLVSSSNPFPNGGGTINRFLTTGSLARSVSTPNEAVTVYSNYELANSFTMAAGCANFNVDNVKTNITVVAQ